MNGALLENSAAVVMGDKDESVFNEEGAVTQNPDSSTDAEDCVNGSIFNQLVKTTHLLNGFRPPGMTDAECFWANNNRTSSRQGWESLLAHHQYYQQQQGCSKSFPDTSQATQQQQPQGSEENKENELLTHDAKADAKTASQPAALPEKPTTAAKESTSEQGETAKKEDEIPDSPASSSTPSMPSDYVGLALKQWSVYLGNVLLNFIHKECKEGQQQSSRLANGMHSDAATSVTSTGYCPCCHYHNQMAAQQQQQQPQQHHQHTTQHQSNHHQSNHQSQSSSSNTSLFPHTLHQGYYNYAANFSPFLTNQRAYVQGKDPSVDYTQDPIEESEDERCFDDGLSDSVPPIELPACEIGRLEEISDLVGSCLPSPIRREKLAAAIEHESYIKKLLNLFHMCEDLENTEGLHHLYEIFKNIFLLNKNSLFELMFAEETIFDVVGCLEFDPTSPVPKRHRQYLRSEAMFHEVLPINNQELLSKIHQTYRVQYIQDCVLPIPSVFEENMLSTLSSFIFFNKVEIVSLIQEDEKFLTELFSQLTDEKTDETRRKEMVMFLKEYCTLAQTLQPQSRESFFKTLNQLGILPALEITLQAENKQTKAASIDILLFIVEFSPSMVREYMLQQLSNTEDDSLLMNVIIEQMTCDSAPDTGGDVQLKGIIQTLIDPENMLASVNKSEKTDFLNHFYKHCMHILIAPLLANTANDQPEESDTCPDQLLSHILDLLSFCVEHHTYHIKNYILHKDLLRRILVLMKSRHKYLACGALRFMRKIINLKDEFYNRYIIKGNLFAPVIDAYDSNGGRYNLLESAILELFEFIKQEDIKSFCTHVVENFWPIIEKYKHVQHVQTFKALKLRYDQQQERLRDRSQTQLETVGGILRPGRFRRDPRQPDEEEEMWFNDDEDDAAAQLTSASATMASTSPVAATQQPVNACPTAQQANGVNQNDSSHHAAGEEGGPIAQTDISTGSIGRVLAEDKKKEKTSEKPSTPPGINSDSPTPNSSPSNPKRALVDYGPDSDDEESEESFDDPESDVPAAKRQRTQ